MHKSWFCFLYAVDCIDCAADASVVSAVNEGIDVAASIVPSVQRPWVMVSVNDDCRDLHFRKAGKQTIYYSSSLIFENHLCYCKMILLL
jgi:Fe-S-cluster-containing hydrogenase component 2